MMGMELCLYLENPNVELDYSDAKGNLELVFKTPEYPGILACSLSLDYNITEVIPNGDEIMFRLTNQDIYFNGHYVGKLDDDIDDVIAILSLSMLDRVEISPVYFEPKVTKIIVSNGYGEYKELKFKG